MSSPPASTPVRHDASRSRYVADVGGHEAFVEYQREAGRMVFTHTWVPPEGRGRGIAEQLVRTALEAARAEGVQIVPQCSYVARFVAQHPEFAQPASRR